MRHDHFRRDYRLWTSLYSQRYKLEFQSNDTWTVAWAYNRRNVGKATSRLHCATPEYWNVKTFFFSFPRSVKERLNSLNKMASRNADKCSALI